MFKYIFFLKLIVIIFYSISLPLYAQNAATMPELTEEEISIYCQNVELIVNLYDPNLQEETLNKFNMTYERFQYVDFKISTFVMEETGIENISEFISKDFFPSNSEKLLLQKHRDLVVNANEKLIKLLTQGIRK